MKLQKQQRQHSPHIGTERIAELPRPTLQNELRDDIDLVLDSASDYIQVISRIGE